jgi:prolyl oligopeptidase
MNKFRILLFALAAAAILSLSLSAPLRFAHAQKNGDGGGSSLAPIKYPETKKDDVVEDYFGTKVPDPYRWLEDDRSPEVAAWVEAQNKVTYAYLDQIPYRAAIKDRLMKLYNYPKYGAPARRGEWFFSTKNDGLQNQSVWYLQKGLDGVPELLLDPNKFSADGTSRLGSLTISHTGKYIGYGISEGGSDWNEIHVLDVATKKPLDDKCMSRLRSHLMTS